MIKTRRKKKGIADLTDDDWTERLWRWAEENDFNDNVLPRNKKDLTKLTKLELCTFKLTEIPTEIGNLTKLTGLDLENNRLTEIPKEIGNLTLLTDLFFLEGNKITKFPKQIRKFLDRIEKKKEIEEKRPMSSVVA